MAANKELILLGVIALIAVIGLILMIKFSHTGLGMYGGSLYPGRAVERISKERFVKGGNPEGVIVDSELRRGYMPFMGMTPCPEEYLQVSKSQYLSNQDYYGECVPNLYPDQYPGIICCKERFSFR